ncbi:MAG TPA: hypothetical protein VFZ21_23910 [Gemmatimonadaceae bacterium]|jgi:hypothetical protein|nr:hypothetical protein [Gemmatimonadaceae bacterium]
MRVYVNAVALDLPDGSTALDAVRAWSAPAADAVAAGEKVLADSRGLPASPDTPLHGGAIFRVLPARRRHDGDEPSD